LLSTVHPVGAIMQKLETLHQFALKQAKQLDEETPIIVSSTDLGEVIEIRPIPEELPEIKPRIKANIKPAELTE